MSQFHFSILNHLVWGSQLYSPFSLVVVWRSGIYSKYVLKATIPRGFEDGRKWALMAEKFHQLRRHRAGVGRRSNSPHIPGGEMRDVGGISSPPRAHSTAMLSTLSVSVDDRPED